jgi:hypothetical protein
VHLITRSLPLLENALVTDSALPDLPSLVSETKDIHTVSKEEAVLNSE